MDLVYKLNGKLEEIKNIVCFKRTNGKFLYGVREKEPNENDSGELVLRLLPDGIEDFYVINL